jgi:hypothetical protein
MNLATTTTTALATATGLHLAGGHGEQPNRHLLVDRPVGAVAVGQQGELWLLVERRHLHRLDPAGAHAEPELVASLPAGAAGVCLGLHQGAVWVGGDRAGLWRLDGAELVPIASFATAPTHDAWYTPWGGPPAVFSLASAGDDLYASVHVGGILRTSDGGRSWVPTIDLHDDVHQVAVGPHGRLWAATGDRALAESEDGGATWRHHDQGLDGNHYLLALAPTASGVIVGASRGHASREGGLYRFDGEHFHHLGPAEGLPEPLGGVVGPRHLVAAGDEAAVALPDGRAARSTDGGRTWAPLPLPPVQAAEVALV